MSAYGDGLYGDASYGGSVTKIQTAISRIAKSFTKTQTGVANIAANPVSTPNVPVLTFRFSPTTNPLDPPAWVDITADVMHFESHRGRQFELDRIEAGTATLTLDNSDRRYDPSNSNSPYYPNIVPLKRFQVMAMLGTNTYYIYTGFCEDWPQTWANPSWSTVELTLVDAFEALSLADVVSTHASLTTSFGSNRDITWTAVSAGGGANQVTVQYIVAGNNTPLSVSVVDVGISIFIATNSAGSAISTANDLISLVNNDLTAGSIITGSLPVGSTGTGVMIPMSPTNLSGGIFEQELSGARINHVLDAIGYPNNAGDRSIDSGQSLVAASTFSPTDGEKALSHIRDVEVSENGYLFVNGQGTVVFHDRDHRTTSSTSNTSQATFGDDTALTELEYTALVPAYNKMYIYNSISVTANNSSNAQTAKDQTSIDQYMLRDYPVSTLLTSDTDALALAQFLLLNFKQPQLRFETMTIEPVEDADLWTQALAREIGDRVTIIRRPPDYSGTPGPPMSQESYIESISWEISDGATYGTVTYMLSPASGGSANALVLDSSTSGTLDGGNTLTL